MKLGRRLQVRILRVLNEILPPFVRDARWLMAVPIRLVFGTRAPLVMDFKTNAYAMTEHEFHDVYAALGRCALGGDTDLNDACRDRILADAFGARVLEVGCGSGTLAVALSRDHEVTACDIVLDRELVARNPDISFREASAEDLPFGDREFDTVACIHTLEHVRNLPAAIAELRRVARRRLLVVVPMERPYRYTFNLHLHFFPYPESLQAAMGVHPESDCSVVDGDLYYREDVCEVRPA